MAITLKLHSIKSEITVNGVTVTPVRRTVYTAPAGGGMVDHLQIANMGDYDTVAVVRTFDEDGFMTRVITLALGPQQVVCPLEKNPVLLEGHCLTIEADSDDVTAALSVVDGIKVEMPYGTLTVSVTGTSGKWSIDGGDTWHTSGHTLRLDAVMYEVTFSEEEGFMSVPPQTVFIELEKDVTVVAEYLAIPMPTPTAGTLKMEMEGLPDAEWSIDDGVTWNPAWRHLLLEAGEYTIKMQDYFGYVTPPNVDVTITAGTDTVKTATYTSQQYTLNPAFYGVEYDNGDEPSGNVIYATPTGAGDKDGSDWSNAAAGIDSAVALAEPSDNIYLWEGIYSFEDTVESGTLNFYGGFNGGGRWEDRNAFTNATNVDGRYRSKRFATSGRCDGIIFTKHNMGVLGMSVAVKNCVFDSCWGVISGSSSNSLFLRCKNKGVMAEGTFNGDPLYVLIKGNVIKCVVSNCEVERGSWAMLIYGSVKESIIEDCRLVGSGGQSVYRFISVPNESGFQDNKVYNCEMININKGYFLSQRGSGVLNVVRCEFYWCKAESFSNTYFISGKAVGCIFYGCSVTDASFNSSNVLTGGLTENCLFISCRGGTLGGLLAAGCFITFRNCMGAVGNASKNILVINHKGYPNSTPESYYMKDYDSGAVFFDGKDSTIKLSSNRPQAGSVLIGAGVAVAGITDDLDGNLRPDPPTIGCYEYVIPEPPEEE